jgi:hypothetical protein
MIMLWTIGHLFLPRRTVRATEPSRTLSGQRLPGPYRLTLVSQHPPTFQGDSVSDDPFSVGPEPAPGTPPTPSPVPPPGPGVAGPPAAPPGPPPLASPGRRLSVRAKVILAATAGALTVLLLAGVLLVAVFVRRDAAATPADWRSADFVVSSAQGMANVDFRQDVGQMLVGRLVLAGAGEARYEPRPNGVRVGVPPEREAILQQLQATLPITTSLALRPVFEVKERPSASCTPTSGVACAPDRRTDYLLGPAIVDGTQLSTAEAQHDDVTQHWGIQLTWTAAGQQALSTATAGLIGQRIAIVASGVAISAPTVQAPITGAQMQISGDFTEAAAQQLAAEARLGRLPVQISTGPSGRTKAAAAPAAATPACGAIAVKANVNV